MAPLNPSIQTRGRSKTNRAEEPEPALKTLEQGFYLSVKEPGVSMYRQASGPTLSHILGLLVSADYLLITNFRSDQTKKQNMDVFVELPKQMRILTGNPDLSGFWLVGHWTEGSIYPGEDPIDDCADLGGQIVDKVEYSWLFTRRPSIPPARWLQAGVTLADQHRQDAFVIALDGNVSVRNHDGSVYRALVDADPATVAGEWENLARLRGGAASSDYVGSRSAPRLSAAQADAPKLNETDAPTRTSAAQSFESSYSFSGPGLATAAEFRMAEPGSISSSMMFYHVGAHTMLSQGIPNVSVEAKTAL